MTTRDSTTRDADSTLARATDGSRVIELVGSVRTATADRLAAVQDRATTVVQHSFLYRWLTAEPDPEVVVIDLRETRTVGPIIASLDRVVATLAPCYRQSRLKRGVDTLAGLAARAADTRPGRVLVTLFEPPEPPEQSSAEDRDESSTDETGDNEPEADE